MKINFISLSENLSTRSKKLIFISELFLAISFLNVLPAIIISNYNFNSFIYKILSALFFAAAVFFNSKARDISLISYLKKKDTRTIIITIIIFLIISGLTLTYSCNAGHGLLKLFSFVVIQLPLIILFNYLIVSADPLRVKIFIFSFIIFVLAASLLSFLINPFDPSQVYSFRVDRWSHIVLGRVTCLLIIVILVYLLNGENFNRRDGNKGRLYYLAALSFTAGFINIIFMTSRGVFLSLVIIMIILLVRSFYDEREKIKFILALLLIPLLTGILLITFTGKMERFSQVFFLRFDDEQSRARIFQFEESLEMIKENPVTGVGFGGFRNYKNDPNLDFLKYPHNIFLEFLTEFGLITGGFFSIALLIILFKGFRRNFIAGLFILFSILLMQTSKDIPSQFWFLLGLYPLVKWEKVVIKG